MIAGKHIIIECEGEHAQLSEADLESILSRAALAAGASILSSHFHRFGPQMGVTGVLVLAESHMTVHTWPEHNFITLDVYTCKPFNPSRLAAHFSRRFRIIEYRCGSARWGPTRTGQSP